MSRRAAAKLREQAAELLELAAELEAAETPKPKRQVLVKPTRPPTELEQQRARDALRKLGYILR